MTRHIPNILTCCNLLAGCLGLLHLSGEDILAVESIAGAGLVTAVFVWASCLFDFLDGFAARALGVSSPIGKELDSLADVVSFGVLPSFLMFELIRSAQTSEGTEIPYLPFAALLIAVLSAVRLAIFNVDETQTESFRGVPTPANALFVTTLPALHDTSLGFLLASPLALAAVAVVSALALVAPIDLFALKFKTFRWADNALRYAFIAVAVGLFIWLGVSAIPPIIIIYIGMSLSAKAFSR